MEKILSIPICSSTPGNFYDMEFYESSGKISLRCTCKAGNNRQMCKHMLAFLRGDSSCMAVNACHNPAELWKQGQNFIAESGLKEYATQCTARLNELEELIRNSKKEEASIKKRLAKAVMP